MSELNAEIKAALDAFDTDKARELLRDALKKPDAETYYLASCVALDDEQKVDFLEKAINLDPFHEKARLALKQGKGEPEATSGGTVEVIDNEAAANTKDSTNKFV